MIFEQLNNYGKTQTPCLFVIDFLSEKAYISSIEEATKSNILFEINQFSNFITQNTHLPQNIAFKRIPPTLETYQKAFQLVQKHLQRGDSYLINLSAPTKIETNLSLKDIFLHSKAKYKLYFKNEFVCFSPEIFIKIENNQIKSYPMKGTISAQIPDAENIILKDEKELSEHYTIVDLIRNDLSQIAKKVRVKNFRYIDKLITNQGDILQVSSEIVGDLPIGYTQNLGNIIQKLLPAGSITGAPKLKTMEIIQKAESFFENYHRNYYTGIFGFFDGKNVDCGVMIRYIENMNDNLYFKSGGGITTMSQLEAEYQELIDKVYLPF
jgi:para-aminobenzoate synthetase component 1